MTPPVVLTIAGSDSGGGAGIQADLKTFAAHQCHGTSVLTAVTAQHTRGVTDVYTLPGSLVTSQLAAVLADFPVQAAKTGMLGSPAAAAAVIARARAGELTHLVVDPVLVATSGDQLGAVGPIEQLLPYATVTTPNVHEATVLVGWPVRTPAEMGQAAKQLAAGGAQVVVVTGGDAAGPMAVDAMWCDGAIRFLRAPRVLTRNTHGTGCTFAAAVAARLALGDPVPEAIARAKAFVTRALAGSADWQLGGGAGPLDHFGWSSEE